MIFINLIQGVRRTRDEQRDLIQGVRRTRDEQSAKRSEAGFKIRILLKLNPNDFELLYLALGLVSEFD